MRQGLRRRHREPQTPGELPGLGGLFRWLKPVLTTPLGERQVVKFVPDLLPQMDAEVAALGRSMSARTKSIEEMKEEPS